MAIFGSRPVSPQTVRLGRGRHRSPRRGACVMELSSMLAGERFTDHPESVCPVLAAFLRAYNDHLPRDRRQALAGWASDAVDTRDLSIRVMARREQSLVSLAGQVYPVSRARAWLDRCLCSHPKATRAGVHCARAVRRHPRLEEHVDRELRRIFGVGVIEPVGPGLEDASVDRSDSPVAPALS